MQYVVVKQLSLYTCRCRLFVYRGLYIVLCRHLRGYITFTKQEYLFNGAPHFPHLKDDNCQIIWFLRMMLYKLLTFDAVSD